MVGPNVCALPTSFSSFRCVMHRASQLKQLPSSVASSSPSNNAGIPILVNGCRGRMGEAVVKAADCEGLKVLPFSFSSTNPSQTVNVCGKEIHMYGTSEQDRVLTSIFNKHPDMIVVDYTVPAAVNDNVNLYCKVGVPFVLGTTGGDHHQLYKTVEGSNVYAVISQQMGKQVVAFLAVMEIMADQFPGAFAGYSLQRREIDYWHQKMGSRGYFTNIIMVYDTVTESHQAGKLDTSGTAKAVISCFQKLGVAFDLDEIRKIRDSKQQIEVMGVPKDYLSGHAFHSYRLTSPDNTVSFEFQHNVCGRSVYAHGTIDAVIFLSHKIHSNADKRIYSMIDVLKEGGMR